MKVAIVHYRGGLMDGVSLEMEKWKKVLSNMGHDVKIVAGNSSAGVDIAVKELGFEHPSFLKIKEEFFNKLSSSEKELKSEIFNLTERFKKTIEFVLKDFDVVIVNNIWSLALSIPLGLAIEEIAKENPEKTFIGHHHDFWWERKALSNPTTYWGREILKEHFPPYLPNIKHVVINSLAKKALKERRGINAAVIPNVFDFNAIFTSQKLKRNLMDRYGISEGTVVALQATRITERKAIEISIDLVAVMKELGRSYIGKRLYDGRRFNGNVVLAFSGLCEKDSKEYEYKLAGKAFEMGVELINLYKDVEKGIYSFWDMYSIADFITYPTILEGWGNQLLEAMAAGKPIVLFEYEVFEKDIKSSGIEYVSLGKDFEVKDSLVKVSDEILQAAAQKVFEILFDSQKYSSIVTKNFEIGKKNFSYQKLQELLEKLLGGDRNGSSS